MSGWDGYKDSVCQHSGVRELDVDLVTQCNGKAVTTWDCKLTTPCQTVVAACKGDQKCQGTLRENGVQYAGDKYYFIRDDEEAILCTTSKDSLVCGLSNNLLIVAHSKDKGDLPRVNKGVHSVMSYLKSTGN